MAMSHFVIVCLFRLVSFPLTPSSGPSPTSPPSPTKCPRDHPPWEQGGRHDHGTMGPWGAWGGNRLGGRWGTRLAADVPPGRWPLFFWALGLFGQEVRQEEKAPDQEARETQIGHGGTYLLWSMPNLPQNTNRRCRAPFGVGV